MIELKARVGEHKFLRKKLSALGAEHLGTFQQTDFYFKVPEGRLKLREVEGANSSELIYYRREDIPGPKLDIAFILKIEKSEQFKRNLKRILDPLIEIRKVREIYRYYNTRIHLDDVEFLGKFIEFEKPTNKRSNNFENDQKYLHKLIELFEINQENLVSLSYSDLALL